MASLTLAYVRQTLWQYASGIPYSSATSTEKLAVDGVINQVRERFYNSGKWRGTVTRARFRVYDDQITLPHTLETVLGCSPVLSDGGATMPLGVYSQWHEFLPGGPGNPVPDGWQGLIDLGEDWPAFRDSPYSTFYIKSVAELTESGSPTITLRGLDDDNKQIFQASGAEGVSLGMNATTSQVFTALAYWTKSAATLGIVKLYAVDVDTAEETLIAVISPQKIISGYRRYKVPSPESGDTVECICKRAFVPCVADTDPVTPGLIGALKLGMMAIRFEDRADFKNAAICWGPNYPEQRPGAPTGAMDLLEQDRQEFDGDSIRAGLQFVGDYGAGSIPAIY